MFGVEKFDICSFEAEFWSFVITGLCNPHKEASHLNSYVDRFDQDDEDVIVFDKVALYVYFLC